MMPIQISFYIIFLLIQIYEKRNNKEFIVINKNKYIFLFIILSTYLFTLKISYSLFALFFLFLIFFIRKYFKFKEISLFNYLLLLIPIFWLLKNFLISGCLIYPINITCDKHISWGTKNKTYSSNPVDVYDAGEAWSKDWPNKKNNTLNYSEYSKNFKWLNTWIDNHLLVIIKKNSLLPTLKVCKL